MPPYWNVQHQHYKTYFGSKPHLHVIFVFKLIGACIKKLLHNHLVNILEIPSTLNTKTRRIKKSDTRPCKNIARKSAESQESQDDPRFFGFAAPLKRRKARRVRKLECHSKKVRKVRTLLLALAESAGILLIETKCQDWLCQCETILAFLAFPHFPNMKKPGKPGKTVSVWSNPWANHIVIGDLLWHTCYIWSSYNKKE